MNAASDWFEKNTSAREKLNRARITGERPAPSVFFDGREGFVPERVARVIAALAAVRYGHDDRLWRYREGVYRPDGDQFVRVQTRELLQEKFRKRHGEEVVGYFRAAEATVGDAEPRQIINCKNGLMDWPALELLAHNPDVVSTIQIPVAWNAEATCPLIEAFLREVLPDDAVEFAFEVIAYCLMTEFPLHNAVLLLGPGSNGKSTFLGMVRALLGARNVSSVPIQALAENRFASAHLHGKLANICGDLDARAIQRSDTFKMLTGGDPITAERKHAQPFEFVSYALPIFSANEAPLTSDQSNAWFRRWLIVPFETTISTERADPHLLRRLTTSAELEGLLVRAVHALQELITRRRFDIPKSVNVAGDRYRDRLDSVRAFVDEKCILDPDAWAARPALYQAYRTWATDGGRLPLSTVSFNEHLRRNLADQVAEQTRHGGVRVWTGIGLLVGEWRSHR